MAGITPVKAIRQHCIECSGGSRKEVRECVITDCALYPFRFGTNPNRCRVGCPENYDSSLNQDDEGQSQGLVRIAKKTPTQLGISNNKRRSPRIPR
jgi:hypothetical protein